MSPPSRRRGLKLHVKIDFDFNVLSPPSRRRGLKRGRLSWRVPRVDQVASLAEAWIETSSQWRIQKSDHVASLAEAWIETPRKQPHHHVHAGRLPRGGVD